MKNIILLTFFLTSLFSQNQIDGRWHLVGYEDNIMYQFEDNYRYSIYSMDGNFGGLEDAGNSPNPYTVINDIITIDLFSGNIVSYQMNYLCNGEVVELNHMEGFNHSILFREGYNYIENECENFIEDCCEVAELEINACGGTGCYIPQCTGNCEWQPMQCWGSTGYCWCVDEDGIEIEGTSTPSSEGFPDCEQSFNECYDFSNLDFGDCEMVLGVGFINEQCQFISGCGWIIDGVDYSDLFYDNLNDCDQNCYNGSECQPGYVDIDGLCFHDGDLGVIQSMIDNSYQSNIDLGCQDEDNFCGSPNPYMDSADNWGWINFDGIGYEMPGNDNGIVEPLELGIQDWENGRLKSFMCGAYIYCQLSGSIPEEINTLTELEIFRVEWNYLSGFIPNSICDLNLNYNDYLEFDISGNRLCPPYPNCINIDSSFLWEQNINECSEVGDANYDNIINVLDIVVIVSIILENSNIDYQILTISDINFDNEVDVLDIIVIIDLILNN